MTTVSQVLNDTADHIGAFGHHKGSGFADPDHTATSPACMIGAIGVVARDDNTVRLDAIRVVNLHLAGRLVTWNDDPNTTAEQVIEVLRAAAVIEESREAQAIIAAANALDAPVVVGARA